MNAAVAPSRLVLAIAVLAYPFAVFLLLDRLGAAWLGGLLMLLLAIRGRFFLRELPQLAWPVILVGTLYLALLLLGDGALVLKLYPAIISLFLLLAFGYTLIHPPSMVEQLARRFGMEISAAGIGYTRAVTAIWCVFFAANAVVSTAITLGGSLRAWTFYNGFLSYVLTGALFAAEYLYRQSFRRRARMKGVEG
ncbi:MAG: hypothetical protein ACREVN_05160 [Gammaproteobacteria bacterium]